jgi:hypothetical protein
MTKSLELVGTIQPQHRVVAHHAGAGFSSPSPDESPSSVPRDLICAFVAAGSQGSGPTSGARLFRHSDDRTAATAACSGTCFQVRRSRIARIAGGVTPYFRDISAIEAPAAKLLRMSITSATVNDVSGCYSPRNLPGSRSGAPDLWRPWSVPTGIFVRCDNSSTVIRSPSNST